MAQLASCTVRFRDEPSPKTDPLGLSSMPYSPVLDATRPFALDLSVSLPESRTIPIVAAHSKVSELFEISRVRRS